MQSRLNEAEQNLESERARCSGNEKVKIRMQAEIDDIAMEYQRVRRLLPLCMPILLGSGKAETDNPPT